MIGVLRSAASHDVTGVALRALLIVAWVALNVWLLWVMGYGQAGDWGIFRAGVARADFIFPPITMVVWQLLVLPIGFVGFAILHFIALLALRDLVLIVVFLGSFPFWHDTLLGNVNMFGVVAGVVALRGSRASGLAYIAFVLLFPKPVFVPLAAYLVWQLPNVRVPAALMSTVVVAVTLASGFADDWLVRAINISGDYPYRAWDIGPTRVLGLTWLVVGAPLAAWLTFKRHPGWAGLAVTPYLVPVYAAVLLFERSLREGARQFVRGVVATD